MLVGVFIAAELNFWQVNAGVAPGSRSPGCARCIPTPSSSRSSGNMMFAGIYYSTQRLVQPGWRAIFSPPFISGLASSSSWERHHAAAGLHARQGVRRAHLAHQ